MSAENLKPIKPIKRQIRDVREFERVELAGIPACHALRQVNRQAGNPNI